MRLRVIHQSGRWDGNAEAFGRHLAKISKRADLITTTESIGMADEARRHLGREWWVRIEGEFIVAGRKAKTSPGPGRLGVISDEFGGSSDWRDTRAHYRWVRVHGSGPLLVIVSHLSSAVQARGRWSGFTQGRRSHQAATAAIGRQVRRRTQLAEKIGGRKVHVLHCTDANLDQKLAVWRLYMRRTQGMSGMWDLKTPRRGTHHDRAIDGQWSTARFVDAEVLDQRPPAGYDHVGVRGVIALPDRGEYHAEPMPRAAA